MAALIADHNRVHIEAWVDGDARSDDMAGGQWIAYPEELLAGPPADQLPDGKLPGQRTAGGP